MNEPIAFLFGFFFGLSVWWLMFKGPDFAMKLLGYEKENKK